jgi:hypothetical protein
MVKPANPLSAFIGLPRQGWWKLHLVDNGVLGGYVSSWGVQTSPLTDVPIASEIPGEFVLHQNYPNPFNPSTKIKFQIPARLQESHEAGGPNLKPQTVSLKVYDILGREVRTLVNENLQPGVYEATFDATGLASGVYFYRLIAQPTSGEQAAVFVETKKLVVMR